MTAKRAGLAQIEDNARRARAQSATRQSWRAPTRSIPPRKEDARCCNAKRDADGRLPVGFCGPHCERRP